MEDEELATANHTVKDSLGREHFPTTRTGRINVYLRSHKYRPSTPASHTSDLYRTLTQREGGVPPVVFLTRDNKSDVAPSNLKAAYFLCRLWRELKLLALRAISNEVDFSFLNPIEGGWCVVGNAGSGM